MPRRRTCPPLSRGVRAPLGQALQIPVPSPPSSHLLKRLDHLHAERKVRREPYTLQRKSLNCRVNLTSISGEVTSPETPHFFCQFCPGGGSARCEFDTHGHGSGRKYHPTTAGSHRHRLRGVPSQKRTVSRGLLREIHTTRYFDNSKSQRMAGGTGRLPHI